MEASERSSPRRALARAASSMRARSTPSTSRRSTAARASPRMQLGGVLCEQRTDPIDAQRSGSELLAPNAGEPKDQLPLDGRLRVMVGNDGCLERFVVLGVLERTDHGFGREAVTDSEEGHELVKRQNAPPWKSSVMVTPQAGLGNGRTTSGSLR